MGTWGTSITQNDLFLDVYSDFYEKWKNGTEIGNIIDELKNEYLQEEDHEFWFALGKGLWETGFLSPDIFEKVKEIISSNANLSLWERSGADEKTLKSRNNALQAFFKKLSTPNLKPKVRKLKIERPPKKVLNPIFDKGDCFTFLLDDKTYGGAVILDKDGVNADGYNLVAVSNLVQKELPVLEDYLNSMILSRTEKVFRPNSQTEFEIREKEQIYWLSAKAFKKEKLAFQRIGTIVEIQSYIDQQEHEIMPYWGYMVSLIKQEVNSGSVKTGRAISELIKNAL